MSPPLYDGNGLREFANNITVMQLCVNVGHIWGRQENFVTPALSVVKITCSSVSWWGLLGLLCWL